MKSISVKLVGISPLLMHNGRLANPMEEWSRKLSDAVKAAKKNKTDASWEAAYQAEFMGSLYLDTDLSPCIPGELIEACITERARKTRQGKQTTAGLVVNGNCKLIYKGPKDAVQMWKAKMYKITSVRIGQKRVMRCRPMFEQWSCDVEVSYLPDLVTERDLLKFLDQAGSEVGLCDYRPRYGRFMVEQ